MDNDILVKVTKYFVYLMMVAGAVMTGLIISNTDAMSTDPALAASILDPTFLLGIGLLGIGIIATLGFAIAQMVSEPKSAIMVLGSIAGLGLIYFLAYISASGNVDAKVYTEFNIDSATSKLIGSLIYLVYFLGGLSILTILASGVNSLMLKR